MIRSIALLCSHYYCSYKYYWLLLLSLLFCFGMVLVPYISKISILCQAKNLNMFSHSITDKPTFRLVSLLGTIPDGASLVHSYFHFLCILHLEELHAVRSPYMLEMWSQDANSPTPNHRKKLKTKQTDVHMA